jgi:hypothetical protein
VSVLPDNGQRWWNPDLRDYPVELTLDETPQGLKPGVRVENAEIFIARHEQALAAPLVAVYTVGRESYVFLRGENGEVKERKVTLGTANETHVQIVDGVREGEQALLLQPGQGRALLEKAGITISEVTVARGPGERPNRGPGARGNREGGEGPGGSEARVENGQGEVAGPGGTRGEGLNDRTGGPGADRQGGAEREARNGGANRSGSEQGEARGERRRGGDRGERPGQSNDGAGRTRETTQSSS